MKDSTKKTLDKILFKTAVVVGCTSAIVFFVNLIFYGCIQGSELASTVVCGRFTVERICVLIHALSFGGVPFASLIVAFLDADMNFLRIFCNKQVPFLSFAAVIAVMIVIGIGYYAYWVVTTLEPVALHLHWN